jgi:hypothetical protein
LGKREGACGEAEVRETDAGGDKVLLWTFTTDD